MSNHDREGSHPSNRDTPLERAWRDASAEQPPTHLDAAIIAAARKSVTDRSQPPLAVPVRGPSRNRFTQWQPLAAAATVAGLAFVLVQMLPREQGLAPSTQRQESAPVATAVEAQSPPQSSPAPAATERGQAPSVDNTAGARERVDVAVDAPAQYAVPAPPTLPAPRASKAAATVSDSAGLLGDSSADRSKAVAPEMDGRGAPAAAPSATAMARERSLGKAAQLDATAWAAKIATLHATGDVAAAEQALRAFRAAEPDADSYLPESLGSWARTVQ